jgi:site-specific recombinase XerD
MRRSVLVDGRPRSAVTLPEYRRGMKPANAGKRYPVEVLTTEEVERLLAVIPRRGFAGPRNRALIVVMWRSGLRVAEALALEPRDVDLERGTVRVRHGKGNQARTVGIDAGPAAVIDLWLQKRQRLAVGRMAPVFCVISGPTRGKELHSAYVREMLKHYAPRAGITKRVHPHGFRHTHAIELAREGVPVPVISRQLGHADLKTTQRYLDHIEPIEVIETIQRREWQEPSHPRPPLRVVA